MNIPRLNEEFRVIRDILLSVAIGGSAALTTLDNFAPASCMQLGQQLPKGSETIAAFNTASEEAVMDLKAGQHERGCAALRSTLAFTERAVRSLHDCMAADPQNRVLAAGFEDVHRQIKRVGDREECLGRPSAGS